MLNKNKFNKGFRSIADILPAIKAPRRLKKAEKHFLTIPLDEQGTAESGLLFQHSVLCQTCMPYRNPGEDVRLWTRKNGRAALQIEAGSAWHKDQQEFLPIGLPFGAKPRLVMFHLNTEAIRTQSPVIELEDSLTAFVNRTLKLDTGGRNIRTVKEQLSRLAAANFRIGTSHEGRSVTIKGTVISGFELWSPQDDRQRVLWPTTVTFSREYFESLVKHAIPLNEAAVACLAHSAMALDLYTWLAQRLHRVAPNAPNFIAWSILKTQFGEGYGRMNNFKREFREQLRRVRGVYPEAKFDLDGRGMTLMHSRPPVPRQLISVK